MSSWIVGQLHGDRRSAEGYLLLRRHYVLPDQERALGRFYPGLIGFVAWLAGMAYLAHKYGVTWRRSNISIGFWDALPLDTRIAIIAIAVGLVAGLFSAARLILTQNAIAEQPLSDLD